MPAVGQRRALRAAARRDASAVHGVKARKDVHRRDAPRSDKTRRRRRSRRRRAFRRRFPGTAWRRPGSRPFDCARARDVCPRAAHALRRAGRRAVAVGVRLAQLGVGPVRSRIRGRRARSAAHPEPRPWTPRAARPPAATPRARSPSCRAGCPPASTRRETPTPHLTARRGCAGCSTVRDIRTLLRACVRRPSGRGFSRMFATECSPTEAADGDKAIRTDSLAFSENPRET